ncbi:hypothetical protein [Desulfoplanes sp.]
MKRATLILFSLLAIACMGRIPCSGAATITFDNLGSAYNGAGQTFSFQGVTFSGWSLGSDGQTCYLTDSEAGGPGTVMASISFDQGPVSMLGFDMFTTGMTYTDSSGQSQTIKPTMGWTGFAPAASGPTDGISFGVPFFSGFSMLQIDNLSYEYVHTPIPGICGLLCSGLLGLAWLKRKRM